ncbi:MAG: hypothetical protein WBE43_03465, partial [Candidatus Acidiferrales bacterium]
EQDAEVEKVLNALGVADRARLHVFNKIDRLSAEDLAILRESFSAGRDATDRLRVLVSARTREGFDDMLRQIEMAMPVDPVVSRHLSLPLANGRELAMIYACGRVLSSEVRDDHIRLEAELPESLATRLEAFASPAKAGQANA